jgi:hypothetical protein
MNSNRTELVNLGQYYTCYDVEVIMDDDGGVLRVMGKSRGIG